MLVHGRYRQFGSHWGVLWWHRCVEIFLPSCHLLGCLIDDRITVSTNMIWFETTIYICSRIIGIITFLTISGSVFRENNFLILKINRMLRRNERVFLAFGWVVSACLILHYFRLLIHILMCRSRRAITRTLNE